MTKIYLFTVEEQQLLALYMPRENRLSLIRAVIKDKENMDMEMQKIAEKALSRLSEITDTEYNEMRFEAAI